MSSPYDDLPMDRWRSKTETLIAEHPLDAQEVVEVALTCWDAILRIKIGGKAQVGVHIFPRPQVMGTFLHELIPLELSDRYPGVWRREATADEKDLVYIPDSSRSVEIKTSSNRSQVFGNRSYAQSGRTVKKDRSGYYLTINFDKFDGSAARPGVRLIHFGWLDESDWIGQKSPTGQQARLAKQIYGTKLVPIYSSRRA